MPPQLVAVDKFDPGIGTLMQVDLVYKARFAGDMCADNTVQSCSAAQIAAALLSTAVPNAANTPPLTGVAPLVIDQSAELTPSGFLLGSADGFDDCAIPGTTQGPPSVGDCTPGEDHVIKTYDVVFTQPGPSLTGADLLPWSGPAGSQVVFDTTAFGLASGTISPNISLVLNANALVWIEATYFYCPNLPPTCAPDFAQTDENMPVEIDVLANDIDVDGVIDCTTLRIVPGMGPSNGTAIVPTNCATSINCPDPDCRVIYTPNAGFCGVDTFSYDVMDDDGALMTSCLVTVTVNPVNVPPVAVDDSDSTNENVPVVIDVCLNDFDPDGLTGCGDDLDCSIPGASNNPITIVAQPDCGGTAVPIFLGGSWKVRFDPPPGFCGACQFTYTVDDTGTPALTSNVATVTVDILAVNEPPVALDDSASTPEGTKVLIDVCKNDFDPDDASGCGAPLDCTDSSNSPFSSITNPDCGGTAVAVFSAGRWRISFTPPVGFCGTCQFTYTVDDTGTPPLTSNVATVTVDVEPVNVPPVAVDDMDSTDENTPVVIDVCQNDSDPDDATGCGDGLDCTIPGAPNNPIVIVAPPDCGGNATPIFFAGRWQVRFDPPADFCGVCQFTYTVRDTGTPALVSNVATVTVDILAVNQPPVAVDDKGASMNGAPVLIDVCANDSDPDEITGCGDPLDCTDPTNNPITLGTQPVCGTFGVVFNDGRWQVRYDPSAGFCGECAITYTIEDTGTPPLSSNVANIVVSVTLTNNPPVANDDFATTPEGIPVAISVLGNDTDPDTAPCGFPIDPGSVVVISPPDPSCGSVNAGPYAGGVITFTPAPGFCGDCSFTYQVCDLDPKAPLCDTAQVTVTVEPVNECPVANDDTAETSVDVPITIAVCDNDFDPDDTSGCGGELDCTSVTVITQPDCGGSATALGDGTVRFIPPPGYVGTCCFTYVVSDLATPPCISNVATVCIEISEPPCLTENRRAPGSLLLFPEFDNRNGIVTMLTVTNTADENIQVEFVYREEYDCLEFNRKEDLTAGDTLTLITNFHNPNHDRGFLYVFAQCPVSNEAVAFNKLIGQVLTVDGLDSFSYGINAVSFQGIGGGATDAECTSLPLTDLNGNNKRDLDGEEYAMAPDSLRIPRFFGQNADYQSELILIGLSGGAQFETTIDFLVYNDNEEEFSSQYAFHCWERLPLLEISNLFGSDFLKFATNNDPAELLGDSNIETGWFRIDGSIASSSATTIYDPAIYAVLVEMVAPDKYVADLPFEHCTQPGGILFPSGNFGQ